MEALARAWRIALLATAAVGAALLLAAQLLPSRPSGAAVTAGVTPLAAGAALSPPRTVPPVTLIDERGRPRTLASFRGRWLVIAPAMTLCQEVCPMTTGALQELSGDLRRAGLASRVSVAEVTVDPWRDTPGRLRAYRRMTGARFDLLTGEQAEIHRLWSFLGVYYARVPQGHPPAVDWLTHRPESFDVEHTDGFFVIDPSGRERVAAEGMPRLAGALSRRLRSLLDAEGRRDLAHPQLPWSARQLLGDLRTLMRSPAGDSAGGSSRSAAPGAVAASRRRRGRLLGGAAALRRRLAALRGHPVVLSAWASWCPDCRAELPLLSAAAERYGPETAFLGADVDDSSGAAEALLAERATAFPSYAVSTESLSWLAPLRGTPTTFFIDPRGKLAGTHIGPYASSAALDAEIERHGGHT